MEKILQNKPEITICSLADTHIGSVSAPSSPYAKRLVDGTHYEKIPMGKFSRILWNLFLGDLNKIGKVDVVINLGDNVDGLQLKQFGMEIADCDIDAQKEWAYEVQKIVIETLNPQYYIGITGTDYHVRFGGNADTDIYKKLRDNFKNVHFIIGDVLSVQIGKMPWSIAHSYPVCKDITPPMEKLIQQHAMEHYLGNEEVAHRVFARAHAHMFIWQSLRGNNYSYVNPCWQATSKFARGRPYLAVRHPDVGMLKIIQSGEQLTPFPMLHPEVHRLSL
jgi:hypothetical protein